MTTKAVYAGSFDPLTNGHVYIISQAAKLFDVVVVALGLNPEKQCTFSERDRLSMLTSISKDYDNVEVGNFRGMLLAEYARSIGAQYIVRGIRSVSDYAFEHQMKMVLRKIAPEIEVVYLIPPPELTEVSSSLVKELVSYSGGEAVVAQYVPEIVLERLMLKKKL